MEADIALYKCTTPIDAATYIGITYDYTLIENGKPTPEGFRGRLVKHWCRDMQIFQGKFDVPDGMHIQGVYETTSETKMVTRKE